MKALVTRKSIIIASIAVLIAITSIVSVNLLGNSGPVTGLANTVSRPIRALASNVARIFEGIYSSIYRYDDLMARHEIALRRVTELERDYREAIEISEENERLRSMLEFRGRHPGFDHEDAYVVGKSGSNWSSSFTIDLGSANSNIERGFPVVTEYGLLIGQVADVGTINSTVVTVLDTTFSAGAFIGNRDTTVTVKGDFTLMREGLLKIDYIDDDIVVRPGDSVVTSGVGEVFPVGLVIGEVVGVHRHSTGIGRYATVRPNRDVETISHVFIITGFETVE